MPETLLMNHIQFDLSSFLKDIQDHVSPSVMIKIGELIINELSGNESMVISDLSVQLTVGLEASACSFTLTNIPDNIEDLVRPGAIVRIYIGYREPLLVFEGYVTGFSISSQPGALPYVTINCLDAKGLMMSNRRVLRSVEVNGLAAIENVLQQYGQYAIRRDIQISRDIPLRIEQNAESDYDWLSRIASLANLEFFILQGIIYLRDPMQLKPPLVVINDERVVLAFTKEICLSGQFGEVQVISYDQSRQKQIIAKTSSVGQHSERLNIAAYNAESLFEEIDIPSSHVFIEPWIIDESQANDRANSIMTRQSMKFVTGKCDVFCMPFLCPGRYIKFTNITGLSGSYYITAVHHQLRSGAYTTALEFAADSY